MVKELRSVTTDLHANSDDLLFIAEGYDGHAAHLRRSWNPYRLTDERKCLAWDLGWVKRQSEQFGHALSAADRRAKDAIVQQLSRWIKMCRSDDLAEVAGEGYEQALRDFRDMLLNQGQYRKQKTRG
jgi:hypothetical protein